MENVKQKETKVVEKVEKVKTPTIANVFKEIAVKGVASRKDLAEKIMADFKSKGITLNSKGKEIRLERVSQQVGAMLRDIKNKRGAETKAWWSTFTIVEDDKQLKIVAN